MKYFIRCKAWSSVKTEQGMIDLIALIKQYSCSGINAADVRLDIEETDVINIELSLIELYTFYNSVNSSLTTLTEQVETLTEQFSNLEIYKPTFIYDGISPQIFQINPNAKISQVFLNRGFLDDLTDWSVSSGILTIENTITLVEFDEIKPIGIII